MIMISITCILTGASPVSSIANIGKRDTTQEDTADDDDNEEVRNTRHDNHLLCLCAPYLITRRYYNSLSYPALIFSLFFSIFYSLPLSLTFSYY